MSIDYRFWKLVAFCGVALVGCSHKTESPKVSVDAPPAAVAPDLVCAEQLTTNVLLHGSGFTPMPSKTLAGGPQLILPKVSLLRTLDLDGTAATGAFVIPDSAADPSTSRVQWQSAKQLSFDVFPELSLTPGLYDVTVTNPDGQAAATFAGSLAAVPRPTATGIAPDILCDAEDDQTVTISGTDFLSVGVTLPVVHIGTKDFQAKAVTGCSDVPGTHAEGAIRRCTAASILIPKGSFAPGKYDVTVTNPATAACVSTDALSLTVVPPPTVAVIAPDLTCDAQGDQAMVVTGTGFLKVGTTLPTVQLGKQSFPAASLSECSEVPGPFTEGKVTSCKSLAFTLPKGALGEGDYVLAVTNPKPTDCQSLEKDVKLHVAPPPAVSAVEADIVCDAQGAQVLTLTGSAFLKVGAALPSIKVGDLMLTATSATMCTDVAGTFAEGVVQSCSKLGFTVAKGALDAGDYDIVVTNPDPAGCQSEEALSLHIAAAPKIASLGAVGICDAQADQNITINGTEFLQVGTALPAVQIGTLMFVPSSTSGCTPVKGTFSEGVIATCTALNVTVPKGSFVPGDYPVVVTNPLPADCATSESVALHVEAPPQVANVAPATVCSGGRLLTVNGSGFLPTPAVALKAAGKADVAANSVALNQAQTQLAVQIGAGAEVGTTYDLVVTNPDSCTDVAPHKTVTVVPGPIVYFADPEVVYNGINTRVTVYATGLTGLVSNVSIVPAGQQSPVTTLTWAPVAGHPNRGQLVIPKNQAAGSYDLMLTDATTCTAVLPNALTVTGTLTVSLKSIDPPFGWTQSETAVTVKRDTSVAAGKPFVATPRAFLNPTNPGANDIAIPLESIAFVDDATLTAVVPKNQPVHAYDLIVVNPDGSVGLLANKFTVEQLAPPTILSATPSSLIAATGQVVKLSGQNFRGSTIALSCQDSAGVATPAPGVTFGTASCVAQDCTQSATINASALSSGSSCVVRLSNSDLSFVDFSALGVTNSSSNLGNAKAGPDMIVGRRALSAASGDATNAARFVYAIGGDGGAAVENAPFSSVEYAPVDLFGTIGAWKTAPYSLGTGRSFAASTKVGRYMYVMGGSDGATALDSAKRALILSPREVPKLDVDDIVPAAQGLTAGYWLYKVSATFGAADSDNPSGESLPSDEFIVKVPPFPGKKIQVVLKWTAPVDSLGVALPNVTGYRVYRTAAVNGASSKEVLLQTITGPTLTFTDDGSLTAGTASALPLGSTGQWATLPTLKAHRKGAAGAAAFDPAPLKAKTTFYVYALGGLDATSTALSSYEFLSVTIQPNDHQTVAAGWTLGVNALAQARWQAGAWAATSETSSLIAAGDTFVYVGGGIGADGTARNKVEAGQVVTGGDFLKMDDLPKDFSGTYAGYGVCAANDQLFTFGGKGAAPSASGTSAFIVATPPALAMNAWNGGLVTLTQPRYLMGSSVQSSFIFLLGGQTATDAASRTTELVLW